MDVGTNILPLRAPSVQKSYTLIPQDFNCGQLIQGHRIRFQLQVFNDSALEIPNVLVEDTLQPGIEYAEQTTTIVGGSSIPDNSPPDTLFPLDEGGRDIGSLGPLGSVSITYEANIAAAGDFPNRVDLSPQPADPAIIELSLPFRQAGYEVSKTLVDPASGTVDPGQVITFNITITNTGTITIPQLPLSDVFDPAFLTFRDASFTPDITATGVLTWTDLIPELSPGGLPPASTLPLTLSFTVRDPLPSREDTFNRVFSQGVPGEDGIQQESTRCARAVVSFATSTSTPTPTPTRTSTPHNGNGGCRNCTVTATATRTTPPPPPPVTPTPVVSLLPETGVDGSPAFPVGLVLALPVLGLALLLALRRRRDE
jgi:uncharacterized repeat protein (TIGR01451 family)/MYXO-CTERM domain-containing protein